MAAIGIRALQRQTSKVIDDVERTREPAFITRHGRPAAVILPIDEGELEDYVLANAPEFVASRREADADLKTGRTQPMDEVFAELKRERRR